MKQAKAKKTAKTKAKAITKPAPKAAVKPAAAVWGEGPWTQPKPKLPTTKTLIAPQNQRPELEDVFNHQVRQTYFPKPGQWRSARSPKAVWGVRAVLITIAIIAWAVAMFHPLVK